MLQYTVSPYGRIPAKSKRQRVRTTNKRNQTLNPATHYCNKNVMLKAEPTVKISAMSPFNPLPAIGQIQNRGYDEEKYKRARSVLLYESCDKARSITRSSGGLNDVNIRLTKSRLNEPLKPLKNRVPTPLTPSFDVNERISKNTMDSMKDKPLHRENTYNVIDPIFLNGPRTNNVPAARRLLTPMLANTKHIAANKTPEIKSDSNASTTQAKTKFKKVALDAVRLHGTETGKLLALRRREDSFGPHQNENEADEQNVLQSPTQKLNQISKIFQSLQMEGRNRDKVKKENNWF